MKRYLSKPKLVYTDVVVCVLLIVLYFVFYVLGLSVSDAYMESSPVSMGYMALPLDQGENSLLLIDKGKSEVLGIQKGKVTFKLTVGAGEKTFYQAENICVDPEDHSFYVHSVDWNVNGFSLDSERILHFDRKGRFLGKVYQKSYSLTEEVNQHRVYDPRIIDGNLYVVYADGESVTQLRIQDGEGVPVATHSYPEAWIFFQNFAQRGEQDFYGVEKTGHLLHFQGEEVETAYTFQKEQKEVLYFVEVDPEGNLYYTDIYNGRVCRVTGPNQSQVIARVEDFYPQGELGPGQDQMISLKISQVGDELVLGFALQGRALLCDGSGRVLLESDSFKKATPFLVKAIFVWAIFILGGIFCIYLTLRVIFYLAVNRPVISTLWKVEIGFAIFAIFLTVLILTRSYSNFEMMYFNSQANHLEDLALTGSNLLQEEWIEKIHDMSDFMGEDYRKISEALNLVSAKPEDTSRRFGGALVILEEDGRCYFVAYPDNSIGVYYPTDEYTKAGIEEIYHNKSTKKDLSLLSSGGTFIATSVPIMGREGQVIGVLTVTLDNYMEQAKMDKVIRGIFVNVLLIVILVMFLMNEAFGFAEGYRQYREEKAAFGAGRMPIHLLRIAAFGVSFVLNMTSSFLSVYTTSFWYDKLPIGRELAGAVPLFANGAFMAVSALLCPFLLKKIGFGRLTTLGVLMAMGGDFLAGLSRTYLSIVLALFLNGWGFGILINSLSLTIGKLIDPKQRDSGYTQFNAGCIAGINCGMIFGSILVLQIRHNQVFFVTTVLWALQLVIFLGISRALSKNRLICEEEEAKAEGESQPRKKKMISLEALFYVTCVTFPYALGGSFMYFYLPILVTSLGYTEGYISLLMMIYAVCGIILGKPLTSIMWDRLKGGAMLLAIVMSGIGWMILVSYVNLNMMAMAMLLIGLSYSFGLNVCIATYLGGRGVSKMDPEAAMGLYEFSSRAGQCISSIICGIMMGAGIVLGMGIYAVLSIVLFLLYIFIFRRRQRRVARVAKQ